MSSPRRPSAQPPQGDRKGRPYHIRGGGYFRSTVAGVVVEAGEWQRLPSSSPGRGCSATTNHGERAALVLKQVGLLPFPTVGTV
ncbi:MAG: hypothetical protein ACJ788_24195 [Ktedonobacteraceae bacterium]